MTKERSPGFDVLVVEDEILIAAELSELLRERGHRPTIARRVDDALDLVRGTHFDAVFLDVNLEGESCMPVADALVELHTPFVFMTGYGSGELREIYPAVPLLAKPFGELDVEQSLIQML